MLRKPGKRSGRKVGHSTESVIRAAVARLREQAGGFALGLPGTLAFAAAILLFALPVRATDPLDTRSLLGPTRNRQPQKPPEPKGDSVLG